MQDESHKQNHTNVPDDFQILRLIQQTYLSKNTEDVAAAQATLNQLLRNDKFIEKLFQFLQNQQQLNKTISSPCTSLIQSKEQFKLGVSLLIKRFSYHFSKQFQTPKDIFVQKLFVLLISNLNAKAKQQLGIGLEYILNNDNQQTYKPKIVQKLCEILQSLPEPHLLQGSIIIALACLNSLIEVEDQCLFIEQILPALIQNAINILDLIRKQSNDIISSKVGQDIFKLSKRIFDLLELAFSRMIDEEDLLQDKIDQIRRNPALQLLLFSYLTCFSTNNKSILSPFAYVNNVKQIIVEILFALFRTKPMSKNLFHLFLITFLLESQREVYEQEQEHIVSRVLQMLESQLEQNFNMQEFSDHKKQILCCLMTYSLTKPDEFEMIDENPQRFVEIAEDYTEGFAGSTSIKVRAGSFLKVYASKFDEGLRHIMEWVVIIITGNIQAKDPNSMSVQLYNHLRQECAQIGFFKVDPSLHIQTSFNILSLLFPLIKKRDDLSKIVYAIITLNYQSLQNFTQPIQVLRLIRMIGYYPSAVLYPFIKNKMSLGKVYVLEGLKAFERILKTTKYPQIFLILSEIFEDLINVINVNDHIFETIIMNHYQRVLKKNQNLYNAFLIKLRDTFIENIQNNQTITFSSLGFIYSMLVKENQASYRNKILQYFYSMQEFYNKVLVFHNQKVSQNGDAVVLETSKKVLKNLKNYEDKIVDIYSVLFKKETSISERMITFAIMKLPTLNHYNKNQQIFILYHRMFLKIDAQFDGISAFYEGFMQHIRKIFVSILDPSIQSHNSFAQTLQILPNLSYLVSQILASWSQIRLRQDDIMWMLKVLNSVTQEVRQYLLLIILTYAYNHPLQLRNTLSSINAYYQTLQYLLTTKYEEGLIRKIFLLAMTKLIEIQQTYINDIVRECIKYLKQQFQKNQSKKRPRELIDPKLRLIWEGGEHRQFQNQQEESMNQQILPHQTSSTCCVPDFKHPWITLSEYDQFKIRIWQNSDIVMKLDEKDKNQLREILKMDWVGKSVRKIVSIKQPIDL